MQAQVAFNRNITVRFIEATLNKHVGESKILLDLFEEYSKGSKEEFNMFLESLQCPTYMLELAGQLAFRASNEILANLFKLLEPEVVAGIFNKFFTIFSEQGLPIIHHTLEGNVLIEYDAPSDNQCLDILSRHLLRYDPKEEFTQTIVTSFMYPADLLLYCSDSFVLEIIKRAYDNSELKPLFNALSLAYDYIEECEYNEEEDGTDDILEQLGSYYYVDAVTLNINDVRRLHTIAKNFISQTCGGDPEYLYCHCE